MRLINTQQPQAKVIVLVRLWAGMSPGAGKQTAQGSHVSSVLSLCDTQRDVMGDRCWDDRVFICPCSVLPSLPWLCSTPPFGMGRILPVSGTPALLRSMLKKCCEGKRGAHSSPGSLSCVSYWVWMD